MMRFKVLLVAVASVSRAFVAPPAALVSSSRTGSVVAPTQEDALPLSPCTTSSSLVVQQEGRRRRPSSTKRMMLGNGILGVGSSEVLVIVAVGYFLLGPQELYRLAKEIGKLVSQARNSLAESALEWQKTMEASQFDFQEIRDIQNTARELQDAFSFRSNRYVQEWKDFSLKEPLDDGSAASQFDVDDWNKNIMAQQQQNDLNKNLVAPPPPFPAATNDDQVPGPLDAKKDRALQALEREYAIRLQELQLEYEFKREKTNIEYATSDAELDDVVLNTKKKDDD